MGRLFTIAEGLENMGALRTGGQGSVYKGRRIGEIFTAVKILPTPIHTESDDDKNFHDFQNEVQKLKKVNEAPNPNVVKILNSGITESGSFPFIEMEFIEGPDLEELLQPPHDPVFSVREVVKVADQLASALAHCHKVDVRHGDIKSNNVKFNVHTGNYVLLDFGLSAMSDEQRRTSLRHAGAIEFMAPEQNEGRMLFQTDVYSYGIILYELLAGTVPFPLLNKGETTRNGVMVAHMETPVPDVLSLRREHLPDSWPDDRKEREMQIPEWLLSVIDTCLEKDPEKRFATGIDLHESIIRGSTVAVKSVDERENNATVLQGENGRLLSLVRFYQERAIDGERVGAELKTLLAQKDDEIRTLTEATRSRPVGQPRPIDPSAKLSTNSPTGQPFVPDKSKSPFRRIKTVRLAVIALLVGLVVWTAYSQFGAKPTTSQAYTMEDETNPATDAEPDNRNRAATPSTKTEDISDRPPQNKADKPATKQTKVTQPTPADKSKTVTKRPAKPQVVRRDSSRTSAVSAQPATVSSASDPIPNRKVKRYTLSSKYAYFHNEPDQSTRRAANINIWNNAKLTPLDDRNGFIYVVYTNEQGQTSRGWLLKRNLKPID